MKKVLFLLLLASIYVVNTNAQVTIGSLEVPVPGAGLQLKNINGITNGDANATKGLGFPRVALVKKDQLQPMYSAADAAGLTTEEKQVHTGLVVYNLSEIITEDLTIGLTVWDGEKWNVFEMETPPAIFDVTDCSDVGMFGEYRNAVPINSSNYVKLTVDVTKKGKYSISLMPDPANGYYFTTSGEFMTTGTAEIIVPGAGQPVNYTPTGQQGDHLILSLNEVESTCNDLYLKIEDSSSKPLYAMSCNSVTVSGVYKKGIAVTANEKIKLRLNVYDGAQGATWRIYTDQIDGLSFEGSGVLGAAGTQEVELHAQGTPISSAAKTFTINTNSQATSATCQALVVPLIAKKKIVAIGDPSYGFTSGGSNGGCDVMVKDLMNFGSNENSIVKYEGFDGITVVSSVNTATLNQYTGVTGNNPPYDIILITYPENPTPEEGAILINYVNKGGVLIYLDQNTNSNNVGLVGGMFGENISNAVSIGNTCNQAIKTNPAVDDEISNGPFGDVRGSQWGEDYANTCGLPIVPRGAIVYAHAINASTGVVSSSGAQATMLRHPTKNFFWCGDSGLIAASTSTSNTTAPFKVGARVFNGINYPHYPVNKEGYGSANANNRVPVCNSTLFANVMAWALKMAEENGINSGQ